MRWHVLGYPFTGKWSKMACYHKNIHNKTISLTSSSEILQTYVFSGFVKNLKFKFKKIKVDKPRFLKFKFY